MRVPLLIAGLGLAVSSCSTSMTAAPDEHRFAVRPNHGRDTLEKTRPQEGSRSLPAPTRETFREITIAHGSGRDGFDSIRVFASGKGYAIVSLSDSPDARGIRVSVQLSNSQLDRLLSAMQQDQLNRLEGMYSSGLSDGTQGFVEVVTSAGRVFSWLDNFFEPVAHTYEFCNAQIWPGVMKNLPLHLLEPRHGRQEEYHRIFKE